MHLPPFRGKTPVSGPGLSKGFSLPELLVVISVLVVVLALGLGGLSRVSRMGDLAKCTSNLRQISAAISLYAQDHDGWLPGPTPGGQPFRYRSADNLSEVRTLVNYLVPYLHLPTSSNPKEWLIAEVFQCPGAVRNIGRDDINAHYGQQRTYDQGELLDRPFGYGNTSQGVTEKVSRLSSVKRPSITISLADRSLFEIFGQENHDRLRNVLFMDGSVIPYPLHAFVPRQKESWELIK